ncbi:hypothetical protein ACHAWF_012858 [Thalassiosira exigua]
MRSFRGISKSPLKLLPRAGYHRVRQDLLLRRIRREVLRPPRSRLRRPRQQVPPRVPQLPVHAVAPQVAAGMSS